MLDDLGEHLGGQNKKKDHHEGDSPEPRMLTSKVTQSPYTLNQCIPFLPTSKGLKVDCL